MLNNILSVFFLFVFLLSIIFIFLGEYIISYFPTFRRLQCVKSELGNMSFEKPVSQGVRLIELCKRLIVDFLETGKVTLIRENHGHRSFGNAVELVHYRDRNIRRIIRELKIYAFFLTILGALGFLKLLFQAHFIYSLATLSKAASENPFELIAWFECFMLFFFTIRLCIELSAIKELLDE
jgi:hypothetical protein